MQKSARIRDMQFKAIAHVGGRAEQNVTPLIHIRTADCNPDTYQNGDFSWRDSTRKYMEHTCSSSGGTGNASLGRTLRTN